MAIKLYNLNKVETIVFPVGTFDAVTTEEGNQAIAGVVWEMVPAESTDAFARFVAEEVGADAGQVAQAIEKWYHAHKPS